MQMRFTLRCVQCMAASSLRDQQYTFGVRGLLAAEKALLIRNDLTGMLLRRPMLVDRWDKYLNELGRYVETLMYNI